MMDPEPPEDLGPTVAPEAEELFDPHLNPELCMASAG